MVADFSTSAVAEGKVRLYLKRGQQLPEPWLVDANGAHTDDPAALYDGGAILPMGGHKGDDVLVAEVLDAGLGADAGRGQGLRAHGCGRFRRCR